MGKKVLVKKVPSLGDFIGALFQKFQGTHKADVFKIFPGHCGQWELAARPTPHPYGIAGDMD